MVDGDRVLMHPEDFAYYGLTATGSAVWELIDGTRTLDDLAEALATEYAGDPQTIRADVVTFLAGLDSARLVRYDA